MTHWMLRRTLIALFISFGFTFVGLGIWLLGAQPTSAQTNPAFHPPVTLLDAQGVPVYESGAPASTMATCGTCHDTEFIAATSGHADGALRTVAIEMEPAAPAAP
ncbi:MAG: hypothetical protein NZM00_10530, partial [Anaerolinea sp.]|nr:hypothetical protein [Anaerolinea sp.]